MKLKTDTNWLTNHCNKTHLLDWTELWLDHFAFESFIFLILEEENIRNDQYEAHFVIEKSTSSEKILNRSKYKGIISLDFKQQEWRICSYIKVKGKKDQGEQLRYWGYGVELVGKGISVEELQLSLKVCWLLAIISAPCARFAQI